MRHRNSSRKFNMPSSQRRALMRGLTNQLIKHERITTTLPRAKELRGFAERIITIAKNDNLANRRLVYNRLRDREAVIHLFESIRTRCLHRPGGYLRVLKLESRHGDSADMALVELVDTV
jgi:large subunit ribosomal protein L17